MRTFQFSPWINDSGWYVLDIRWPSGACGCVSRDYPDGAWRIACDPRPNAYRFSYPTREAAAEAERKLAFMARMAGAIGWAELQVLFADAWRV